VLSSVSRQLVSCLFEYSVLAVGVSVYHNTKYQLKQAIINIEVLSATVQGIVQ
jgi:hypothetical protein